MLHKIFRGKRIDNGRWAYGDLIQSQDYTFIASGWIIEGEMEDFTSFDCNALYEVYPHTVCQYICVNDKNGKFIFEGDVVKRFWLGKEIIYRIKYEEYNASFIGMALNTSGFTSFDYDGEMFEIIGNIYDNPELLKGE